MTNTANTNKFGRDKWGQRIFEDRYLNPPKVGTRVLFHMHGETYPGIIVAASQLAVSVYEPAESAFRCDDAITGPTVIGFRKVSPQDISPEAGYTAD